MLKATTQITARLIKDKVWAVFGEGVALTNTMYTNYIFSHPVSKKELGDSSLKIYRELLARSCEANERVQNMAEDTMEAMVINEKIRNAGSLHEELLQPLTVTRQLAHSFESSNGHKQTFCDCLKMIENYSINHVFL